MSDGQSAKQIPTSRVNTIMTNQEPRRCLHDWRKNDLNLNLSERETNTFCVSVVNECGVHHYTLLPYLLYTRLNCILICICFHCILTMYTLSPYTYYVHAVTIYLLCTVYTLSPYTYYVMLLQDTY